MLKKPLVTIITPCYNGEGFLRTYFESILLQTYPNLELIFVNDGSTDQTETIAISYEGRLKERGINFIYLYQENAGQASAMNKAFKYMKGKYLVWPDSDDRLTPDSIEKRVDFLESNPKYDMVRSNGKYFDYETGEILFRISNSKNRDEEDIFLDLIQETTFCACGCYMIRISKFQEIYPKLKIYESRAGQNWQILIPMAGRGKCGYLDEDQYYIAIRTNSHSRKKYTEEEQIKRYLQLKNILLNSVVISERRDKDYRKIIECKYDRILMNYYLQQQKKGKAEKYYNKLKVAGSLTDGDQRAYLSKCNKVKYFLYRTNSFVRRKIMKLV